MEVQLLDLLDGEFGGEGLQMCPRLHAAAEGDFVIAFYNPVSRRRRTLLDEARQILLKHRPEETPVLLASNLGRPDEKLTRRTLATLRTDEVDMLTVVLIEALQRSRLVPEDASIGLVFPALFSIGVIFENSLPFDSTNDDMLQRTGRIDSRLTRHGI